jgi:hypothetical protein
MRFVVIIFLNVVDLQSRNLNPNRETIESAYSGLRTARTAHLVRALYESLILGLLIGAAGRTTASSRRCRTNGNRLLARTETACAHGREPLSSTAGTACAYGPRTDRNRLRARPGSAFDSEHVREPLARTDRARTSHGRELLSRTAGTACDKAESGWAPPPQPRPPPPGSGCHRRRRTGPPGIRPFACHYGAARSAINELRHCRHRRIFYFLHVGDPDSEGSGCPRIPCGCPYIPAWIHYKNPVTTGRPLYQF